MKAITVRYAGPTDHTGSRLIVSDGDGNRMTVPYDHGAFDAYDDACKALCRRMGWEGRLASGELNKDTRVYVFDHSPGDRIHVCKTID